MNSSNLLTDIRVSSLKGIGDKTEKLFGKVGIDNLDQLIHYYPRAYDACRKCTTLENLLPGEKEAVLVKIKNPAVIKKGSRTAITILNVQENGKRLELLWFNMPYLRSVLKVGSMVVFRGMVREKNKGLQMEQPEIYSQSDYEKMQGRIQPIYALTAGLKNKMVAKAVKQMLEKYSFLEYLPQNVLQKNKLVSRQEAVCHIHFPQNEEELLEARNRIVFDEFLFYLLKLGRIGKEIKEYKNLCEFQNPDVADHFISNLPFELTGAQRRVWSEIKEDLVSEHTMNRLLQGDVGSGKTIVAFLAMILMIENGYQCALMVPTEVLASQHFESFQRLLEERGLDKGRILLLVGSLSQKEKREAYERIASGEVKAVIGTHAVIQEKVHFSNLALVITDEQHRFGVRQRGIIAEKGNRPHVLVMSATPIPRTLALIMYGDLKISLLDEMPSNRLKIKNCVVDKSSRKTAYTFMQREVQAGHQGYVICPMIEENEDLECENVLEYSQKLKKVFPADTHIGMLHGRMSSEEKKNVMQQFSENKIQILVSTTVVEVGVDVPNATVMLIENAERFGLAQLHQLRGRIGRGSAQSYCIFMQGNPKEETNKRLEILNNSNDGFYIAQEDLKLRGQGDLFGLRQSGETEFLLADLFKDAKILKIAAETAGEILKEDPDLLSDKYQKLGKVLDQMKQQTEGIL